jgi:glucosylceramidase
MEDNMKLHSYTTHGEPKAMEEELELPFVPDDGTENEVINIYRQMRYQTMEGFGGALTDAAGSVFAKMNEAQQEELLTRYFSPEEMNYVMVRMPIDSCDFATHMYAADDKEGDENFETFDFRDVEQYMLPLLDRAEIKCGKKIPIMLSPWSPPAYMKTNGVRKGGGSLKTEYYGAWAAYICRYIKEYETRGYEVKRLSVQNEPKAVQTWDSCVYTPEEEKVFVRDYLYPEMRKNNLTHIEIFIWDHNKERAFERACSIIDETTNKMIAGVAFHWYSGDHFEALSLIREKFPNKKLMLSESCLEFSKYGKGEQCQNAGRLAHDMIGNLNHGMNGFYDWNILLDEKGGPNHVGNYCDAPFLFDTVGKELEERYALKYYWHFSHFIRPGAIRIATTCYTSDLDVTAWENPDGSVVLIVLNRTAEEIPYVVRDGGQMVVCSAKPFSLTTAVIIL